MFEDSFQAIVSFKNSTLAKHYFRKAVSAAIYKKFDKAYRYIEKSYRICPNDFRYALLRGVLGSINGDEIVGAESCAKAYELLEHGEMADIDREYLRAVAAFWASYYSPESGQSTDFESKFSKHAGNFELSAVSRKWLYFFPAKFLNNWVEPAVLDKDAGFFSYSRRRLYPRYIWGGIAFGASLYVITGEYIYAILGFLAGLVWTYFDIRTEL